MFLKSADGAPRYLGYRSVMCRSTKNVKFNRVVDLLPFYISLHRMETISSLALNNFTALFTFLASDLGGYYHGKLVFPADFPFRPPAICMFLYMMFAVIEPILDMFTPSGR